MCGPHVTLSDMRLLIKPITVHLPNSQGANVKHINTYHFNSKIVLHNVLRIHDFDVNLISVTKLTKKLKCNFSFHHDHCLIQDSNIRLISIYG